MTASRHSQAKCYEVDINPKLVFIKYSPSRAFTRCFFISSFGIGMF